MNLIPVVFLTERNDVNIFAEAAIAEGCVMACYPMKANPDCYNCFIKMKSKGYIRKSAGILLYRRTGKELEVFLVHPGGPFWERSGNGAWSIPKGEFSDEEIPLTAAIREFEEETGKPVPGNKFLELTPIKQKAGKLVYAWATEGNLDAAAIQSNTFRMEWPSKSGKWITIPEVDKADWFTPEAAKEKIIPAQAAFIDELQRKLEQ